MGILTAAVLSLAGAHTAQAQTEGRVTLRVPIYPYIPDAAGDQFASLLTRLETEFEQQHPDVDLVLNPSCFQDDFYEPSTIARSLKGEGECAYDVIETDTVILGELVATGAVRPWSRLPENVFWHPAGIASSFHQGKLYGIPHWLCGHFVISRDEDVRRARTVSDLLQALEARQTPAPDIAGDLLGSWNLPALYLDAWADTNGARRIESAVTTSHYDPSALDGLRRVTQACETNGANPCVDGTYSDNFDLAATLFAQGQADATLGYSERLHTILKNLPEGQSASDIKLSSAPLGEGDRPILFTDSYFLSVRCTGACEQAARRFVDYMSRPSTFEWILMSEDAPAGTRVPRYLVPATLDAFATPKVRRDPFYPSIALEVLDGMPFPNEGLLDIRRQMRDDILDAITR
nr:extracellular solute-binding protein [Pyxidicoccus fallax]